MRRDLKKSLQLATHVFMAGHAHMTRLESDEHFSVFWLAQYTAYKLSRLALAANSSCNLQLGSLVLTLQYMCNGAHTTICAMVLTRRGFVKFVHLVYQQ